MLWVGVVGSRNYPNLDEVERFVWALARKYPDAVVVSGGARGVDQTAEETAHAARLRVRSYRPVRRERHYEVLIHETGRFAVTVKDEHGAPLRFRNFAAAAYGRNPMIVTDVSQLAAFTYQGSKGTANTIEHARAAGIGVHIFEPNY